MSNKARTFRSWSRYAYDVTFDAPEFKKFRKQPYLANRGTGKGRKALREWKQNRDKTRNKLAHMTALHDLQDQQKSVMRSGMFDIVRATSPKAGRRR